MSLQQQVSAASLAVQNLNSQMLRFLAIDPGYPAARRAQEAAAAKLRAQLNRMQRHIERRFHKSEE